MVLLTLNQARLLTRKVVYEMTQIGCSKALSTKGPIFAIGMLHNEHKFIVMVNMQDSCPGCSLIELAKLAQTVRDNDGLTRQDEID